MSISEPNEFDAWLAAMVQQHGEFTALVILTQIAGSRVTPLCSTYVHVIGNEVDWSEIVVMFAGSGHSWDGAAFFPTKAATGGPVDNPTAHRRLRELEQKVSEDRMILNDGHFFDALGRRIKIEPVVDA
ncbi:MAG: hypothetical protein ABL904_25350 [Hyphomicrobiaceae bacterium]